MIRVVVIGLGLEGLITGWVFRQHPHLDVRLVGPPPLGGSHDRFPPIVHTESMGNLLREINVPHASYKHSDGILIAGNVERYPDVLRQHSLNADRIYNDWQRKAGLPLTKLNGELRRRSRPRRIRCELTDLLHALTYRSDITVTDEWRLEPGVIVLDRQCFDYDFAVITSPLWECRRRVWFTIPPAKTSVRTVALVSGPKAVRFRKWDRVLTPYTPDDAIYELLDQGDQYQAVINGQRSIGALLSDLNYLFPTGYGISSIREDYGRVEPLAHRPRWPENVAPLGAYSEWREALPLDETLDGAYRLMRRWMGR